MGRNVATIMGISLAASVIVGCESTGGGNTSNSVVPAGNSAEASARNACLQAVKSETNNPKVAVRSSEFSEAGTKVIVVVGDQQAAWECIAYKDGTTSRPMSLTNEGAL